VSKGIEHWRSLATTFITFFLEWDYLAGSLDLRVGTGTAEPFYLHLFKGCVLFESLLKANPNYTTGFRPSDQLNVILDALEQQTGMRSPSQYGATMFPRIVADVTHADNQLTTAIAYAVRVRNTVGHNLGWDADFERLHYDKLASMVASACLHAINCLYR
jgi:hypothetical protein